MVRLFGLFFLKHLQNFMCQGTIYLSLTIFAENCFNILIFFRRDGLLRLKFPKKRRRAVNFLSACVILLLYTCSGFRIKQSKNNLFKHTALVHGVSKT